MTEVTEEKGGHERVTNDGLRIEAILNPSFKFVTLSWIEP